MSNNINLPQQEQPTKPKDSLDTGNIINTGQLPIEQQPTTNNQQPTTDMEVHHHAHHGHEKKTWKSYFWEFFMLFAAVFCGSLAELQLEHYIEHKREHKYAETLLEDLVNDTLDLRGDIKIWGRVIDKVDTIRLEIEKPKALRNQPLLYKSVSMLGFNNSFLYHDRTIQQLKSSGNFRLMQRGKIADSLVEYDAWIQKTLNQIESIYSQVNAPATTTLQNQLFNSKFYGIARKNALFDSAVLAEPAVIEIREGKEDILFQFYNELNNYKGLNQTRVFFQKMLLQMAKNMIAMIKKEYHLE